MVPVLPVVSPVPWVPQVPGFSVVLLVPCFFHFPLIPMVSRAPLVPVVTQVFVVPVVPLVWGVSSSFCSSFVPGKSLCLLLVPGFPWFFLIQLFLGINQVALSYRLP